MKKLNKNALRLAVALTVLLAVTACDKPHHSVYGTDLLKVYAVKTIDNPKYGKYEYWITDGTGKGWTLRTNNEYEIGDILTINVKDS